jgi:hypothetical protein
MIAGGSRAAGLISNKDAEPFLTLFTFKLAILVDRKGK